MADRIDEIEGIGDKYAATLGEHGIKNTEDLLVAAGSKTGREKLAAASGISETLILKWVNHADLMRIKGVGGEYAELLEAAGVDSVKELKHRRPDNLAAKVAEVNDAKSLTRRVPAESEITRWIEEAATLEPRVTH
jgi:predicted flap endonuclease-1-like 5' DNA nuclease